MRLSDIMSAMDLAAYPAAALVLFMAAFAALAVRTWGRQRREEMERAARLPLDEDP